MKCSDSVWSPSSVHRCLCQIGTNQSARTDLDSAKISSDYIGLRGIPHRNGAEYVGESKDLLFVVPYNTSWPINHCPHLNQVGQWGTYLWSHATANWLGTTLDAKINTSLANMIEMETMIDWPTGVAWDHK